MKLSVTCEFCSRQFFAFASAKRKFCSRDCQNQSLRGKRPHNYQRTVRSCCQCGSTFSISHSSSQQHCSDTCARKTQAVNRRKPPVSLLCTTCGRGFIVKRQSRVVKFCGAECRRVSRLGHSPHNKLPRQAIICGYCKLPFGVPLGNKLNRKYCSKQCRYAAIKGSIPHNAKEHISIFCGYCSREFFLPPARAQTAKFCSRHCASFHKTLTRGERHPLWKPKVTQTCKWCKRQFEAKPAKVRMGEGLFCSRNCAGASCSYVQNGRRSSIEVAVEKELSRRGVAFETQKPLGPWLVDFYLPDRKLVIECDGKYWHNKPEIAAKDRKKNWWVMNNGYRIARIPEAAIRIDVIKAVNVALTTDGEL